jgi:hypothetical protein
MIPMPRPDEVEPPPLPAGAAVGSFVLARVQARDEFSIRYVATASASGAEVSIEEYAPVGLSLRDAGGTLRPRSHAHAAVWEEGLQAFVQESELLAKPLHPALIRVAALWQVRGTAFRLWPRLEGTTLTEVCASMTEPPTEEWLRGLVAPLLDALESLHEGGWVHGNVCPSQILMLSAGGPTLLDTAAARTAIGARMLQPADWPEPGFRPPELAEPASGQVPGPWSDLYSLAAVARFCMVAPHAAGGLAQLPGALSIGRYDSRFVSAFESALANDPRERPRTVAEFRQQLLRSTPAAISTLPFAASRRKVAAAEFMAPPVLVPDPAPLGSATAPIELEREPGLRRAWLEPVDADPPWAREATRKLPARRWPWALAGTLAVLASAALATYQLTRDESMPIAANGPALSPSAEQLLERDPTATGPVAHVAPEPRPEPAQTVAPLAPLPSTVPDASRPLSDAARSERAAPATALAPRPSPAPETPVERRAAAPDAPAAMCAPRTNFALYRCMQLQCQQSRYQTHPQCVRLRQNDKLPT